MRSFLPTAGVVFVVVRLLASPRQQPHYICVLPCPPQTCAKDCLLLPYEKLPNLRYNTPIVLISSCREREFGLEHRKSVAILHYAGPPLVGGVEVTIAAHARVLAAW